MIALLSALLLLSGTSIYDFSIDGLTGGTVNLGDYKGKKVLIVNTASKCGLTPQYSQLEELYRKYNSRLVIVGFPANNFGNQEPGTDEEIAEFCELNYSVTFPMTTKISVKGDDMHPLYRWLTSKRLNGFADSEVRWNFQKYLIDEDGNLIAVFDPGVQPLSEEIIKAVEN